MRSVSIRLVTSAGSRDDPRDKAGISHFVEHLLFRGTERHPTESAQLAHVKSMGGATNAQTTKEWTSIDLDVSPRHLPAALRHIADMVLRSTFNGLEVERRIVLEEMAQTYEETDGTIWREEPLGDTKLWPRSSLGIPVIGERLTVLGITLADARHYLEGHYRAGGMVLSIAGGFRLEEIMKDVEEAFGGVPAGQPFKSRTVPATSTGALHVLEQPNSSRSTVLMLFPCAGMGPSAITASFAAFVLSYDGAARIHDVVRSRGGLAYSADADLVLYSDVGRIAIRSDVMKEKVPQVVAAVSKTLRELRDRGPTPAEMIAARESYESFLERMMSSPATAALLNAVNTLYDEPSIEEEIELLRRVSADEVVAYARSVFQAKTGHIVIAGPREDDDFKAAWRSFATQLGD